MRSLSLALIIVATASATPAVAGGYRYCLIGCDFGGSHGDCIFSSYQQCQASAAGRVGWCAENPDFNARAEMRDDRNRQSRRRL